MPLIYKICPAAQWRAAEAAGCFKGSAVDLADGYIHFSTAAQVHETAAKHFRGLADLVLIAVETEGLGAALKWEPSRGGDLFPHLYADLPADAALWCRPLLLQADGTHVLPDLAGEEQTI